MSTPSKKVAVILCGCGHRDGSEIHEAVCTLLALSQHGAHTQCFAPDMVQHTVVNHLSGEPDTAASPRNTLVEAARIARGNILPLSDFRPADYDAVIFPGGLGAATLLSDFASKGAACTVLPAVVHIITAMNLSGKPIGALCIAPALLAKVIPGLRLTVGCDSATAHTLQALDATHEPTSHGQIVVDDDNKVVTTPCYMLPDASVAQIYDGANALVAHILKMA